MLDSDASAREIPTKVANGKYRVINKIGSGSFGVIYQGCHDIYNESIAVKFESVRCRHPQLLYEAKIYKMLGGIIGVPGIYWWGIEQGWSLIVIELLGPSLEDLFSASQRTFSLRSVLLLGEQMLNRIEILHNYSYLHRDIKPDNFLMGSSKTLYQKFFPPLMPSGERVRTTASLWMPNPESKYNIVFMCDFGLCKRYRDARTWVHIPWRAGKSLTGTARYCSLATHFGVEQSRRDDIEALGYVLLYLRNGQLPWQGLPATDKKEKYYQVQTKKKTTALETLCAGNRGNIFIEFLRYARHLGFQEAPDYTYLRDLLKKAYTEEFYPMELTFDWTSKLENGDHRMLNLWHVPNFEAVKFPKNNLLIPYIPAQRHIPQDGVVSFFDSIDTVCKESYNELIKEGGYQTDFPPETLAQENIENKFTPHATLRPVTIQNILDAYNGNRDKASNMIKAFNNSKDFYPKRSNAIQMCANAVPRSVE